MRQRLPGRWHSALRGLNKRVKLFLYCADNLISGNAFKLGDIITYRNGKVQ